MREENAHDTQPAAPSGAPGAGSAEAFLAAIAASSNDAIVGKSLDGVVTYWNGAAERLFGFTSGEMIGQPISTLIPPELISEESALLGRVAAGERLAHFETRRLTRDGHAIPVSLTMSPVRAHDGRIIGVSKIVRDLSRSEQMNKALTQRENLLSSILDTVPDGLVVIDEDGLIRHFSPAAERMFGFTAQEAAGRNVRILMPGADSAAHDSYLERYKKTGERRIIGIGRVVVGLRKNGTTFPMELQIGEASAGGSRLFTGFVRDLTERQERDRRLEELQAELIHLARVSELGQMVTTLAHELNQPLTAMDNYLSGLRRMLASDTPSHLRAVIEKIATQSARARGIVQSLRELVRKEQQPRQLESVETMVLETSALLLIGKMRAVSLDMRIAEDARYALVNKVQIQQVLLNLMRNAVEAMQTTSSRELTVSAMRRQNWIDIRVSDTGPGLAEGVLTRLFQPFVTTKPDGLGVGLSICRTIVEAHGGELVAEENGEGGATFRFSVPAAGG